MLGKLLKYDLKWIYKVIVVFYILAFVFSIIGRGLSLIENSLVFTVIKEIAFGAAISMMISSLINCFMRLWVRFIRNIYKDEAYLTHTLPIEKKTIYLSKVLSVLITVFTSVVVVIACLFICYYSPENMKALKTMLELAAETYDTTVFNLLLLISVVIFLQVMLIVLIGYIGIILGYKANKGKTLKAIVIGFGLYMVNQVLALAGIYGVALIKPDVMSLFNTTTVIDVSTIKTVMYVAIVLYVIEIVFYYILGKKQFEKGVNVE